MRFSIRACILVCCLGETGGALEIDVAAIVSGVAFERGKLQQGEFTITGTRSLHRLSGEVVDVKFEDHGKFDFALGARMYRHEGTIEGPTSDEYRLFEGRWIVGYVPDATYLYSSYGNINHVLMFEPETDRFSGIGLASFGFFDPRTLGLTQDMSLRKTPRLEDVLEEFRSTVEGQYEAEALGDGMYALNRVFQTPGGPGSQVGVGRIVVDAFSGFSVLERTVGSRFVGPDGRTLITPAEHFALTPPDPSNLSDTLGRALAREVLSQSQVSWEERKDVWIPVSFEFRFFKQEYDRLPNGNMDPESARLLESRISGAIDWSSVNVPFQDAAFSYRNFDVPARTYVADMRDGEGTLIDLIHDELPGIESRYGPLTYGLGAVFVVLVCGTLWLAKRRLNA